MYKSTFLFLTVLFLGCTPQPVEDDMPTACTCDILQNRELLSGIEYESIESNRNRAALDSQQHLLVEAGLKGDKKLSFDGDFKVVFPINRKGNGYYVKYKIIADKVNPQQQQYFIAYCSKFYDYVDAETCQIKSEHQTTFSQVKEALLKRYLSPKSPTLKPNQGSKSRKTTFTTCTDPQDHYDFHQQLKRRKSAGQYADLYEELFQFFKSSNSSNADLTRSIRHARDLYHRDNFAASSDILLSAFETHFINQ